MDRQYDTFPMAQHVRGFNKGVEILIEISNINFFIYFHVQQSQIISCIENNM